MKKGLIITGGGLDLSFAGEFLQKRIFECLVSVDKGLERTQALGLTPDAIVGDFDSVDPKILEAYGRDSHILWDIHKPEKNETDTELAILTAIKLGCTDLTILGATGGRLDHELSNIHLLKMCLDQGIRACLYDRQNKIYLLDRGKRFQRQDQYGKYISFVPMTEKVKGITLKGFLYPLTKKTISIGLEAGRCISNELALDEAEISFDSGILICIESKDLEQEKLDRSNL